MANLKYMRTTLLAASSGLSLLGSQAWARQAAAPPGADTVEEVVVLGVKGAQRAAISVKRDAPQIVDSIVAEDIGKLPDTTIADSLQRVPGVQISRSAGEGSSLNIRGLQQVLVTLNGEQFLGGQNIAGAQPDFSDIPATLFSGVDVIKSPTASQLEGGVSGIVGLKTRRPFDLQSGWSLAASAEGAYGSRTEKVNGLYSGLVGWRNERLGALVAGAYSDSTLANISLNTGNSWRKTTDAKSGVDLRGDGDVTDSTAFGDKDYAYQPDVVSLTNRTTERKRYGLNASAQGDMGGGVTLIGDVSYTRLKQHDRFASVQLNSSYAPLVLQPGSKVDENGVISVGSFLLPSFRQNSFSSPSTSEALNTNLQLDYDNGGKFKGSVRWVHADATRDSESSQSDSAPVRTSLVPRGAPANCQATPTPANCIYANPNGYSAVAATIDYTGKYPTVAFGTDVATAANYALLSTWAYGDKNDSKLDAYRADGSYEADWGVLKSVDFGGRYAEREISVENYKYEAPMGGLSGPNDLYYFKDPQIIHSCTSAQAGAGRCTNLGYSIVPLQPFSSLGSTIQRFNDFSPVKGFPANGIPAVDPRAMDNPKAFQDSLFPGNVAYVDPTTSYRVTEKTKTLYGQANFAGTTGAGGVPFAGNIGLRMVKTDRTILSSTTNPDNYIGAGGSYNGVSVNLGTNENEKSYTDWLPSANVSLDIADDMKLRFAVAKVVGRLNLYDLGAGSVNYYGANNGRNPSLPNDLQLYLGGNSGNPDLDPFRSTNFNVSYEWYFAPGGLFSAGAFLFDVKSFPQRVTTIQLLPDQDGVVREGGPVTRTENGGGGTIKGLELGYQQNFDFLPSFWSGFGAAANYTFSDSESSNVDLLGKTLPVPDNSKHQVNLIGFYQKDKLQARVAYNWRSKRFAGLQSAGDDNLAVWSKAVGYLDASASYDVTPQITAYVQGTNLGDAFDEQYLQFENQYYSQTLYERRLTVGVRLRY